MLKNWLQAFRLRTLPLALGAITMGAFTAKVNGVFQWDIYILCLVTAIFLQILSNLANDYGDFKKGTDNDQRKGPARALQSGIITEKAMLRAVVLFSVLSLACGIWVIWLGLKNFSSWQTFAMIGIGLAAIAAAIKYTIGKSAYGYSGLGDIFVFIFFGFVAVGGTYFLITGQLDWQILLPAICMGCLSVSVLNINNIRDIENDKASNKITVAVRLGRHKAKRYQLILFLVGYNSIAFFVSRNIDSLWVFMAMTVLWIPLFFSFKRVQKNKEGEELALNKELKFTSLGSALLAVGLFIISFFV